VRWRRSVPARTTTPSVSAQPEQAWHALSLVNALITQAETKLGVVLAAAGVSGGILFDLVYSQVGHSLGIDAVATVCAVLVFIAGSCAMIGLYPRVMLRRQHTGHITNPLFFLDIARVYEDNPMAYSKELQKLTTRPDDLVHHLAQQIHANATIVQRKYRWADWAVKALLLDLLALALLATIIALEK
jgi:hypothetical protein